jgi:predicted RNA polymerase sigma factor
LAEQTRAPARTEYERALELAHKDHERRFLRRRIAEVSA